VSGCQTSPAVIESTRCDMGVVYLRTCVCVCDTVCVHTRSHHWPPVYTAQLAISGKGAPSDSGRVASLHILGPPTVGHCTGPLRLALLSFLLFPPPLPSSWSPHPLPPSESRRRKKTFIEKYYGQEESEALTTRSHQSTPLSSPSLAPRVTVAV
jgi:hypothetical protein